MKEVICETNPMKEMILQNSPYERDAFNLIRLHRSKAVYSIVTISMIVESA